MAKPINKNPNKSIKKKRAADPLKTDGGYRDRYKRLSKIINFGFNYKSKKPFTPAQKTAITRQFNRYGSDKGLLRQVEEGGTQFRALKRGAKKAALSKNYAVSNKGVFFRVKTREGTAPNVIVSKNKTDRTYNVKVKYKSRVDVLHTPRPGENFMEFYRRMLDKNPDFIRLKVGRNPGGDALPQNLAAMYMPKIAEIMNKYDRKNQDHPFTGVYISEVHPEWLLK